MNATAEMAEILRAIAYPRRGTSEEAMDIFEAAALVQKTFTLEQLEHFSASESEAKPG